MRYIVVFRRKKNYEIQKKFIFSSPLDAFHSSLSNVQIHQILTSDEKTSSRYKTKLLACLTYLINAIKKMFISTFKPPPPKKNEIQRNLHRTHE